MASQDVIIEYGVAGGGGDEGKNMRNSRRENLKFEIDFGGDRCGISGGCDKDANFEMGISERRTNWKA